jgi:poly(A)-specific ribonuclease
MDLNGSNFSSEVVKVLQNIADSRFIAFDFEFSGVAGRRANKSGRLSAQDYYADLREAAQIYQILQVGLTIVTEDIENGT